MVNVGRFVKQFNEEKKTPEKVTKQIQDTKLRLEATKKVGNPF